MKIETSFLMPYIKSGKKSLADHGKNFYKKFFNVLTVT